MKAEELRKGNYVLQDGELIAGITTNSIHKFDLGQIELEPIPLTEEWLIKLGFTCLDLNGWKFGLNISALPLLARQNFGHWYFELGGIYLGDIIKHVHTLQNFCYVFGKELEVKS